MRLCHRVFWQEARRNVRGVPALSGTYVDGDDTVIISTEREFDGILGWVIWIYLLNFDRLLLDAGLVFYCVDLLLVPILALGVAPIILRAIPPILPVFKISPAQKG